MTSCSFNKDVVTVIVHNFCKTSIILKIVRTLNSVSARGGGFKRLHLTVNGEGLCIERYSHSKNDISPLIKPTHIVHATAAEYC